MSGFCDCIFENKNVQVKQLKSEQNFVNYYKNRSPDLPQRYGGDLVWVCHAPGAPFGS